MQAPSRSLLTTPTTTEGVHHLYRLVEEKLAANGTTRDPCLEKLLHATEKAFADRLLFHDENESLLKQNDERRVRQNAKSTVISQGDAKIISSADIVEMQRRQAAKADAKRAKADARKAKSDAKKAKAAAKTAEADAKQSQVPAQRQGKVELVIPNHEDNVEAHRNVMVVNYSAPCPNRAPVAQMW
jgi:biotin carboxyl carrier protein